MNDRKYELGHEHIGRLLARYSAPAMFAMLVNSMYNLVDAIFVGQGPGALALAALAVCFPIQMFILATAQVVGIGSASIISRNLGAGNQRKAEQTAGTSFGTVTVLSAVLTLLGLAFLTPLLKLFGATPAILPYAEQYLSVILGGSFFFAFNVSTNNIVRSEGNVKWAMVSMLIGALTNIVLDPLFIFGFGMGIRGAAIATVIANACAFTYLNWYFVSGRSLLRLRRADLAPDPALVREMSAIGLSSFTRVSAQSLVAIIINNSIAHYGSDMHLAILGVMNRLMLFFLMPLFGLVQGFQPIVGFNYGARNLERAKAALWTTVGAAMCISTFAFIVLMLFPRLLFRLFNDNPALITEGSGILRIMILCLPFVGFQIVGATLFQALGRVGPALFLSMSRQILFLIPLVLILPLFFGLRGIWMSIPLADFMALLVTAAWVFVEIRRFNRLAREMP